MMRPLFLCPAPHIRRASRGVTLFYAILIGSIILLIGASMLNLALKEFLLSASVRESEYAFFAADSGSECALYWDLHGYVSGSVVSPVFQITNTADTANQYYVNPAYNNVYVRCNGGTVTWGYAPEGMAEVAVGLRGATTTFSYDIGASGQPHYCTVVRVIKNIVYNNTTHDDEVWTTIDARGYNFSCSDTSVNTRNVERAITTSYPRGL